MTQASTIEDLQQSFQASQQRSAADVGLIGFDVPKRTEGPGGLGLAGVGIASENSIATLSRSSRIPRGRFDPGFVLAGLDDDTRAALYDGIGPAFVDGLAEAQSREDAFQIRERLLEIQENERILNEAGIAGFGARVVGAATDPIGLAIGFASGGASTVGRAGQLIDRGNRLRRLARAGIITGTTEGLLEAGIGSQDPTRGVGDAVLAGLFAGTLGGFGRGVGDNLENTRRLTAKRIELATLEAQQDAGTLTVLRPEYFNEVSAGSRIARVKQLATDLADQADPRERDAFLREVDIGIGRGDFDGLLSRMDGPPTPDVVETLGDFATNITTEQTALTGVRFSIAASLGRSKSALVRGLSGTYVQDALLKVSGAVSPEAASEWVTRQFRARVGQWQAASDSAFREWRAALGTSAGKEIEDRFRFHELVYKGVIGVGDEAVRNPHVRRMVEATQEHQRRVLRLAQRHKVRGLEDIPDNDSYMARLWSEARMDKAISQHGEDAVIGWFAQSLRNAHDITDDLALRWGRGMYRIIRNSQKTTEFERSLASAGHDPRLLTAMLKDNVEGITDAEIDTVLRGLGMNRPQAIRDAIIGVLGEADTRLDNALVERIQAVAGRDLDRLRSGLRDNVADITDDEIESIIDRVRGRSSKGTAITARALRRNLIDETTVHNGLSITDLVETDASVLVQLSTRQLLGASAETKLFDAASRFTGKAIDDIDDLKLAVTDELKKAGVSKRRIDSTVKLVDTIHRSVAGRRMSADTAFNEFSRIMRLASHITTSGQFGFAQVPEFGITIASAGFRTMLQQVPAMAKLLSRAKSGKMTNQLLDELQVLVGAGQSRTLNQVTARFDEGAAVFDFGGGRLETGLRRVARVADDISLMAPMHILQKNMVGALAAQKFLNLARTGKGLSSKRLAQLGLSEADGAAITRMMKSDAVKTEDGLFGRRLLSINLGEWTDQAAAAKFVTALDRWSTRAVLEPDIGNLAPWMVSDLGRLIFQYRTFSLTSWEKHLLNNASVRDTQAFLEMTTAMMFAALGYTVQQSILSVGREDQAEYLDERLSVDTLARVAFQRAGYSSILPDAADSLLTLGGYEPKFTFRNSGLSTVNTVEGVLSNPSTALLNNIAKAASETGRAVREGPTERTGRAIGKLIPFNRSFGVANVIQGIAGRLSE